MAKRSTRPSWFKMFLYQKPLIDSVPDKTVGKAIKAAFQYFETAECPDLDPLSFAIFSSLKPCIDESFSDFRRDVENGKKGGRPPKPPVTNGNYAQPNQTEAEAEAEAKADTEEENIKADKPPISTRHKYGEYKNVLLTDDELSKLQLEIPKYAQLIEDLSEYIASSGKKYKSHYATIRKWSKSSGGSATPSSREPDEDEKAAVMRMIKED